jgi:hypothetical protein
MEPLLSSQTYIHSEPLHLSEFAGPILFLLLVIFLVLKYRKKCTHPVPPTPGKTKAPLTQRSLFLISI